MHLNTSDGAEKALAALKPKDLCPSCGSPVHKWYSPNLSDPGDVDPRADCTNPTCDWGY